MTLLPIAERELRVAARLPRIYRTRVAAALAACLVGAWIYLAQGTQVSPPAQMGQQLFRALGNLIFVYVLLVGIRATADCLSEEKREGTLGLLFLTDLKGYDVVLGKMVAMSVHAFYVVLAVTPILALPLLLGGVTVVQFWRFVLLLLNVLFFSLSAGLFVSSLSRDDRRAMYGTFLVILMVAVGIPALGLFLTLYGKIDTAFESPLIFKLPSPVYALSVVQDLAAAKTPANAKLHFLWSMAAIFLFGLGFLGFACLWSPRSWQDKPASRRRIRWREDWQRWCFGSSDERRKFRSRLLEINPFFWLAGRDQIKPLLVWSFLGLMALAWILGWAKWRADWMSVPVAIAYAFVWHATIKVWVTHEASRRFVEDRRNGALELLLSTPLRITEILEGQELALKRQFGGPVMAVLAGDMLLLVLGLRDNLDFRERADVALAFGVGMIVFVADLYALNWVSLWLALSAKKMHRASLGAMVRILLLPWFLLVMTSVFYEILRLSQAFLLEIEHAILGWFTISLVVDLAFGWTARRRLLTRFRTAATQQYALRAVGRATPTAYLSSAKKLATMGR